jgi:hypothetical protein
MAPTPAGSGAVEAGSHNLPQLLPDRARTRTQIHGGEADGVVLHQDALPQRESLGRMQQQCHCRGQVQVQALLQELKDEGRVQLDGGRRWRLTPVATASDVLWNPAEFGQPANCPWMRSLHQVGGEVPVKPSDRLSIRRRSTKADVTIRPDENHAA